MKRPPDSNGFYWLREQGERPVVVEVKDGRVRWTNGRVEAFLRDDTVIESSPMFVPHGIRQADRLSHMYIVGKTGTGKSTLLRTLCAEDLIAGRGFCLIDPHGDLAEGVAADAKRLGKPVIYWNVPDPSSPYGYNPLRQVRADKIPLAVSGLMECFKKQWGGSSWGVRMEHIMRNTLYALLEMPGATLPDILRLLSDEGYRAAVVDRLTNPAVRTFWRDEYPRYSAGYRADGIGPIQNKVGAFLADPTMNRILTRPKEDLHLRAIMDSGGVLIVNLGKGMIGEDSANLLGSLLVTTLGLAAFSREDTPEQDRRPFFLYLDEFHNFTTTSLAGMASELRKYKVGMVLAHQHLHQLDEGVRRGILGNVGTHVVFRVGPEDANLLAREMAQIFGAADLLALPNYHIALAMMIDGAPSRGFSGVTVRP